jgi:aryl-alcohol dehydrogenase-like predicted oxidoreductase
MDMSYRRLGASGLLVSPLCLGTMMFGAQTDQAEASRIVDRARDAGINFLDTANVYNRGDSERVTGQLIGPKRDAWVLATKLANPFGRGPNQRGSGRKAVLKAVDDSLRRLATDYVDILYLHVDDYETPLDETVGALAQLIAQGKVLYLGVSNFPSWRIAEIVHVCADAGIQPPIVCQPNYNAVSRSAELEVLPACGHFGLGVANYSPLARGILSGKYSSGAKPDPNSRAGRNDPRMMESEWRPESLAIAAKLVERARQRGMTPVQFAILWCLNNALVTSVIAGPRTLAQWDDYLGIAELDWHPEDEAFVDSLVARGAMSTPGFVDPKYPVSGRVPLAG